ncbi:restriction endonuclease subunit S [Marinobacter adhaerens]|uniref:Restriction endonuclease subunit S n=1 Tax=Marinobacter adhaerens TaxID=1033846 RepID=A0A851HRM2_9GAMM|nr:restriction endonuclease subunit S [Marinobacter adhaerens]NWN89932.1 restriction endonuclease subunit S [Marinobacter adhaerens]
MTPNSMVSVGDIAEVFDGPHATPKKLESGPYFLSISSLIKGALDLSQSAHLSEEDFKQWTKRVTPEPGDILFSYETRLGEAAMMPTGIRACLGRRMGLLRPDRTRVIPEYLLYAYLSPDFQSTIEQRKIHGATVDRIALKELPSFPIRVPSIAEQRVVVDNLKALDDKIQLNHKINQTLEQMAQTIFKSWFVDFEPAKAKIAALEAGGSDEGALLAAMQAISGKGEAELTRLQAGQPEQYAELRATAELFPSALQDSELGEIPEGWEVAPLSAMVNLIGGGTPKKSEPAFWNGNICWFSVKDVPSDGNVFVVETEDKITEEGLNRSSTKLLPIGTTIITARGTVGKLALTGVSTAMNQSCYGVVASDETGPYLNYLRLSEGVDTLKRNTHGAVFDTITRSTFDTVLQSRSCLALRQRFEQTVTPMFEAIRNNLIQSNTLSEARDSLLPKLLSGELAVSAAETQLTDAEELADV